MVGNATEDPSLEKLGNPWKKVFLIEFIVIAIINVFTVVAFVRNRHLRKRTTYLIINLTVADLLVGAVSGPLTIFAPYFDDGHGFSWREVIISTSIHVFPIASQANLLLISLERLHATLFPFRHCLIEKWLYFKVIIGSWMITLFLAFMMSVLEMLELVLIRYLFLCYTSLTLLIITVSYVIIIIKVRSNPPPQHLSAVASERKLSVTLSVVTVVSILTILPASIWMAIKDHIFSQMSLAAVVHIHETLIFCQFYGQSIDIYHKNARV